MITRRAFVGGLTAAGLAGPLAVKAQPAGTMHRIGYLGNSSLSSESALLEGFRQGLRERGYIEGTNIAFEYRWAEEKIEVMPGLAAQLVRLKVDVILTAGTPAALAVKAATTSIPIVLAALGDPVGAGLVSSLARPGGNVTGLSALSPELEGKRLQLLKEMVPRLHRVVVLMNPANPVSGLVWKQTQAAAASARVAVQPVEARGANDLGPAFATITKVKADGMIVMPDRSTLIPHRVQIVTFAARSRLPAVYTFPEFVQEGGLVAYGPNFPDLYRRAATYVDKILKGAKPGDLPVEQPTKFELVINLKTAKALGLTIPHSMLLRADQVIQ